MTKYLTLIRFTEAGARNIRKSTARARAFRKAAAKAGVQVEAQLWTSGACDGVMILSAEEEKNVFRCLAELSASGNVRTETLRAFDSDEFDALLKR